MTVYTERFVSGLLKECHEVEQILGKALGYPYLDHTVCAGCHPVAGCLCGDPQVCVGEHTLVSLAMEAAKKLKRLEDAGKI